MIKINDKKIKDPIRPIYIKDAENKSTEEIWEEINIDRIIKENQYV